MNVYTCIDFRGHYPVGTAAIVVARDIKEAERILKHKLESIKLDQEGEAFTLQEIETRVPNVKILNDGDY